jgi:hypothetical protein
MAADNAPLDDAADCSQEHDMEYDDTGVCVSFTSVAFTSHSSSFIDLSIYWVVDSACSVNLTTFRYDFPKLSPSSRHSTIGGVGLSVLGRGIVRVPICFVSCKTVFRHVHSLYTLDLSSRSAQKTRRLLSVT